MTKYFELGAIIEVAIPNKKLEGMSDRRKRNLFRRTIQDIHNNLLEYKGFKVFTIVDVNGGIGIENVVLSDDMFCYIHDFDFGADNLVPQNPDYIVGRYFGTDIIIEAPDEYTQEDIAEYTMHVASGKPKQIKGKVLVKISNSTVGEIKQRTLGYCL